MSNLYFVVYQFRNLNGREGIGTAQIEMGSICNIQDIETISDKLERLKGHKSVVVTNWRRFEPD